MFDSSNGDSDIKKGHINNLGAYVITAGLTNNGILGKTDVKARLFDKGTLTIDMFGFAFYRQFAYKLVTHARVFSLIPKLRISANQGLFLASSFHFLRKEFGYENMCSWVKIKNKRIQLPTKNGKIDFDFMESFIAELEAERIAELEAERIAELEAYLFATGLKDYELTEEEQKALDEYEEFEFGDFKYQFIFDKIAQGRRLKKDDQIKGDIPFVMAGITNTGVVNYISNPVASFPQNSITIDIFGNTFYRNYSYGAGDDTGVYWSGEEKYSKDLMLFFATSMGKSLEGKFSYGKKLRSSQSFDFKMKLPTKKGKPNYAIMETLISAIHKLVIKDVVVYADRKINITKSVLL